MSFAACADRVDRVPSATPRAVSKPSVVAGYCATCVICSGARCSVIVAIADSGVGWPDAGAQVAAGRATAAFVSRPGCASRITRYWLVSVKIVETMRWPNAL